MASTSAEEELIERARRHDAQAFAALVTLHKDRTWAVCMRITGNAHDAEDALQDALVAAWRNIDRFRGDALFSTWLHRIAANAALAHVRRRRDVPTADEDLDSPTGADEFSRVDEADRIQSALRNIPEDFRVALVLREYGGLTYDEIARHQRVPVQTVKSRLNRARRAVADQLTP